MDRYILEAALAPLLTELRGLRADVKKLSERPAAPAKAPWPETPYTRPSALPPPLTGYTCATCGAWVLFYMSHVCVKW